MSGKIFAPNKTTGLVSDPNDATNKYGDITGTSKTVDGDAKRGLDLNLMGTSIGSPLDNVKWDALDVQQTSATVETYVFKTGGISGTVVATCVVTYVASDKADLDTVVWS